MKNSFSAKFNARFSFLTLFLITSIISLLILSGCQSAGPTPDPQPPQEDQPEEIIEDETNIMLAPDDPGRILGEEITPEFPAMSEVGKRQFRAMTFNLHLWGSSKAEKTTALVKKGGKAQKLEVAIFSLFNTWQADVIALQEIYKKPSETMVPFKKSHGDFEVLYGKSIFTSKKGKKEYCAIAYRKSKMKCTSLATQWALSRKIHWAQCTLSPPPTPKKTFIFGCAHFEPKSVGVQGNISEFFEKLYSAKPPPTVNGVGQDDFIIGGDFNSYYHGLLGSRWNREHRKFSRKNPKPEKLTFVEIKPNQSQGGFTKVHKRKKSGKPVIKIAKDKSKRIIDDLFWQLRPRHIDYRNGSKQVVPVTKLKTGGTWKDFWIEYYNLSDHLPVKADFQY